jgi:anti-sigma factor RsiW
MGLRTLFGRKRPLACQEVPELVTAYLEDAMSPATRSRFEAHLANCDGCEAYLGQFRFTVNTLGTVSDSDLDPVFRARLMQAFAETTGS